MQWSHEPVEHTENTVPEEVAVFLSFSSHSYQDKQLEIKQEDNDGWLSGWGWGTIHQRGCVSTAAEGLHIWAATTTITYLHSDFTVYLSREMYVFLLKN